jgi:hypothetical protein
LGRSAIIPRHIGKRGLAGEDGADLSRRRGAAGDQRFHTGRLQAHVLPGAAHFDLVAGDCVARVRPLRGSLGGGERRVLSSPVGAPEGGVESLQGEPLGARERRPRNGLNWGGSGCATLRRSWRGEGGAGKRDCRDESDPGSGFH